MLFFCTVNFAWGRVIRGLILKLIPFDRNFPFSELFSGNESWTKSPQAFMVKTYLISQNVEGHPYYENEST